MRPHRTPTRIHTHPARAHTPYAHTYPPSPLPASHTHSLSACHAELFTKSIPAPNVVLPLTPGVPLRGVLSLSLGVGLRICVGVCVCVGVGLCVPTRLSSPIPELMLEELELDELDWLEGNGKLDCGNPPIEGCW